MPKPNKVFDPPNVPPVTVHKRGYPTRGSQESRRILGTLMESKGPSALNAARFRFV